MALPLPEERKKLYKECVESAALKPSEAHMWSGAESSEWYEARSSQLSDAESSAQSNVFFE